MPSVHPGCLIPVCLGLRHLAEFIVTGAPVVVVVGRRLQVNSLVVILDGLLVRGEGPCCRIVPRGYLSSIKRGSAETFLVGPALGVKLGMRYRHQFMKGAQIKQRICLAYCIIRFRGPSTSYSLPDMGVL